jgi:RecA-family ATPase
MPTKKAPDANEIHRTQGPDALRKAIDAAVPLSPKRGPMTLEELDADVKKVAREIERKRNGKAADDDTSFGGRGRSAAELQQEALKSQDNPDGEKTAEPIVEELAKHQAGEQSGDKEPKREPLPFINIAAWDDEPVPQQDWAVPDRIPLRQCTPFSGEGASGKSTIQLHLSAAHVLGKDWLGSLPEPGPAIFVDAEDDKQVIHRRLAAVANHFQVTFKELATAGLHLLSFAGKDAVLATFSRNGKIEATALYRQILEAAGDIKPKMIGIASSANVFAGSEIDRSQVQQFVSLLTAVAIAANGSIVLISHPSLEGIKSDTGLSGSTQWHNSVRARFYLKGVKPDADEEPDNDIRELVFRKNNYGPISTAVVLRYQRGLFLPVQGRTSLDKIAAEAKADEIFLELLARFTKGNRNVRHQKGANFAPALFAKEREAATAGLNGKALEAAMRRLFAAEKIWNEPHGPPSRRTSHIAEKTKSDTAA